MRILRKITLAACLGLLAASSGCAQVGEKLVEGLFNGMIDAVYESQFRERNEETGLTAEEKRARFEEGHIRFMLEDRAYRDGGRVPDAP